MTPRKSRCVQGCRNSGAKHVRFSAAVVRVRGSGSWLAWPTLTNKSLGPLGVYTNFLSRKIHRVGPAIFTSRYTVPKKHPLDIRALSRSDRVAGWRRVAALAVPTRLPSMPFLLTMPPRG